MPKYSFLIESLCISFLFAIKRYDMQRVRQIFIQAFMSRGILDQAEVRELHRESCKMADANYDPDDLLPIVQQINSDIKLVDMEIKKALSEDTGAANYVLVCTADSELLKLSCEYTPQEYDFFRSLVESIVCSAEGSITSTEALNLTCGSKRIDIEVAERLIHRFSRTKWICNEKGRVWLNTRTLVELDSYIRESFPDDVIECEICRKICIKGLNCEGCSVKMHKHCAGRIFANHPDPRCPRTSCQTSWPHSTLNTGTANEETPSHSQAPSQLVNGTGGRSGGMVNGESPSHSQTPSQLVNGTSGRNSAQRTASRASYRRGGETSEESAESSPAPRRRLMNRGSARNSDQDMSTTD